RNLQSKIGLVAARGRAKGFTNYLISIPILFLTLFIHENIVVNGATPIKGFIYFVLLALLVFSHPFTLLVYMGFALIISLLNFRALRTRRFFGVAVPLMVMALFVGWYLKNFGVPAQVNPEALKISWWPKTSVIKYLLLPFTGMQVTEGYDFSFVVLWGSCALLMIVIALSKRNIFSFRAQHIVLFELALAGYLFLPFWVGDYSYFNLRISIICYFLLGIILKNFHVNTDLVLCPRQIDNKPFG
ncbi:MAG: hypothetical protein QME81_19930, partial [bacterium]|nr:hypothetical protein [bacterium]